LKIEFVAGISVFVSIEDSPGPQNFLALRPRPAEQLLDLPKTELGELSLQFNPAAGCIAAKTKQNA
jgi:hypothetical protein